MIQQYHHGIRSACAGIAAAATLFCTAPAGAAVINFSSLPASAHLSGTVLTENGYNMRLLEGPVAAYYGDVSGTGTIADPDNPFTCDIITCPTGADGNYLMVLNDGAVRFSRASRIGGFKLTGLDLAFLAPVEVADGNYGMLRLFGTELDGTVTTAYLDFPGQNAAGNFSFDSASITRDFSRLTLANLTIDACLYNALDECVNSFDNPAFNQAQFALDNLSFSEVPEPGSLLLAGFGFGALALQRRRQRVASRVAANATPALKGA